MSTTFSQLLSTRLEKLRRTPDGNLVARCPICALSGRDTKAEHLKIWSNTGAFNCIVGSDDLSHNRAIRAYLYDKVDEETLLRLALSSTVDPAPKLDIDPVYPESLLSELVPDYSYWLKRGVSEDAIRLLEGGLYPSDRRGKMEGRFVFPVRDRGTGRIMGWTGRLTDESRSFGPKWKHLVRTSRCVYPVTQTDKYIRAAQSVVVLESVGDALVCATHGITNILILLGLNLNSRILGYLVSANLKHGVIISTNNDSLGRTDELGKPTNNGAGNSAAIKLRGKLLPYLGENKVRIRLPQTAKDWGGASVEELATFRSEIEELKNT